MSGVKWPKENMKMQVIKNRRLRVFTLVGLAVGSNICSIPVFASNLTITPTFDSSITGLSNAAQIESSINSAISAIETDITSNSKLNIKIDFKQSTTGLGSSLIQKEDISYSSYLSLLNSNSSKSSIQTTALASLPTGSSTGVNNNATQVMLTPANLLAIGNPNPPGGASVKVLELLGGGFDGTVSLNLGLINSSNYDLQALALHEIDEVLGAGGSGSTLDSKGATDIGALDLFRYSAPGVRDYSESVSAVSYFSIDGGVTKLVNFNQQVTFDSTNVPSADYGDWGNASNTKSGNTPPQVQDAYGAPGATISLGINELTALNVVGWNLTPAGMLAAGIASPVPLPGAAWLMLSSLLGCVGLSRRKAGSCSVG